MKNLQKQFQTRLNAFRKDMAEMDKDMLHDESVQDDTAWVNDYHNLQGHIEELEAVIDVLAGKIDKAKHKKK